MALQLFKRVRMTDTVAMCTEQLLSKEEREFGGMPFPYGNFSFLKNKKLTTFFW